MNKVVILAMALILGSCAAFEPKAAVLWTDRPEFAIYAAYFNSSQDQYKVEVRHLASPAQELTRVRDYPDIVAGSWLKCSATRTLFKPLDNLLKKKIKAENFYPRLLALGRIENKQYLFPVSFNIPAMIIAHNNSPRLSNLFTISLDEIKALGKAYNLESRGVYSRMGFCFSPPWNDEFLFISAALFDVSFKEASPLIWDTSALERTIRYIRDWIEDANTSIAAEDEFAFKYFYEPSSKLVVSERILFAYMKSSEFFTLAEEQRANLDFRWIAKNDRIPMSEESVYYGVCKKGKAKQAARAFTEWFFQEETQRLLLDAGRKYRINETVFGIAHGFSALRTVTEHIFPQFYPGLLEHMPPEAFLDPPNTLPWSWGALKEQVILPYLRARVRAPENDVEHSLRWHLAEWMRLNRN